MTDLTQPTMLLDTLDDEQLNSIIANMEARIEGFGLFPYDLTNVEKVARVKTMEKTLSLYKAEQYRRTHVSVAR